MKRFLFVIACSLLLNNIAFADENDVEIYAGKTKLNKEQIRRLKNLKVGQAMVVNDGKNKYILENYGAKSIANYISFEMDFLLENQFYRNHQAFIDKQFHRNTFNFGFSLANETYFYVHKQFFTPYIGQIVNFAFVNAPSIAESGVKYTWLHDFFNIGLRVGNVFYFQNRDKNPTYTKGIGMYVNAGFDIAQYVYDITNNTTKSHYGHVHTSYNFKGKRRFGYGYFLGGGIDFYLAKGARIGLFYKMSHIMFGDTLLDDIGGKMINFKQLSIHTIGFKMSAIFPPLFES